MVWGGREYELLEYNIYLKSDPHLTKRIVLFASIIAL